MEVLFQKRECCDIEWLEGRGEAGGPWPLKFFRYRRTFGNLMLPRTIFELLLLLKRKVSNFIGKSLNQYTRVKKETFGIILMAVTMM